MDFINISLIIAVGMTLFLGLSIYLHHKKGDKFTVIFSLLALNLALWTTAMILFRYVSSEDTAFTVVKALYAIPLFIPVLFLYFTTFFTQSKFRTSIRHTVLSLVFGISFVMVYLVVFTDKFLTGVSIPLDGEKNIFFGDLYILYVIHYITLFSLSFLLLIKKYFSDIAPAMKNQILTLFIGTFISLSFGLLANLIMPWFGYYELDWLANFTSIVFMGFIMYAIVQYKLFNLSIIAIELFIIFILSLLAVDAIYYQTQTELLVKIALFISISVLSIFLIRSAYREVKQREQIEKLAGDLEKANVRLKELDQLKSEFVSIASHQLRSPLTAIKGYTSLILDGSFGAVSDSVRDAIQKVFTSSNLMAKSIQDFLDVSRIEQGKMKYDCEVFDMKDVVKTVSDEQIVVAKEKGLAFALKVDATKEYKVNGDIGKIKQMLTNIVDNSIKYTPEGSITMTLKNGDQGKILVEVTDTGVGIKKEMVSKLFGKFVRAEGASKVNSKGTGLGLYVVKQMVEAHKGRVWATSPGEGKGSTFHLELNAV